MNRIARALVITLGVLRLVPATIYLTIGVMGVAFIELAGPAWEPLATPLSMFFTLGGAWRGFRRYWALNTWTRWEL